MSMGIPIHRRYADGDESSHSRFETDEDSLPADAGSSQRPPSNLFVVDAPYTQRYDYAGTSNVVYMGQAVPGQLANTGLAVWRIRKFEYDVGGNVVSVSWAAGTARKNQVWDNRAVLVYS